MSSQRNALLLNPSQKLRQEEITVFLTMGSKDMLTLETDENLKSLIKTEFKNGNLKIFCEPNIKKSKARNVYLTADQIQTIERKTASGGNVSAG